MSKDMIDRRELDMLRDEYIELCIEEASWEGCNNPLNPFSEKRQKRLDEITKLVGDSIANEWSNKVEEIEKSA
ncbi:MAG: hypothetical protein WC119_00765 [Synergistaceae bacterium]